MSSPEFTGQYVVTGLDAVTIMVKLEHCDPKRTRVHYLRRIGSSRIRAFTMCLACTCRMFSSRISDDGRLQLIEAIKKSRIVVCLMEPYDDNECCPRCSGHMK